jgi:histidine phosphotransferase ChpT
MAQSADLASLLCSRLCHDLLSPVGAMTHGLELLADETDPEMRERCFQLLEQSARTSADKLKFFRLAFGAAGGIEENVPVADAQELVEALVAGNDRIAVNWAIASETLPKPATKTMLNFASMGIEALVRGGTLDVAVELGVTVCEIAVRAGGPRIAFDEAIGQALESRLPEDEMTSRNAQAVMLYRLAEARGGRLQYVLDEEALVLGAMLPLD